MLSPYSSFSLFSSTFSFSWSTTITVYSVLPFSKSHYPIYSTPPVSHSCSYLMTYTVPLSYWKVLLPQSHDRSISCPDSVVQFLHLSILCFPRHVCCVSFQSRFPLRPQSSPCRFSSFSKQFLPLAPCNHQPSSPRTVVFSLSFLECYVRSSRSNYFPVCDER